MPRLAMVFLVACAARPPQSPMTPAAPDQPALDEQFLAASAETLGFKLGVPKVMALTGDGAVLFRRTPARGFAADLFELDMATGQVTTLVTSAELLGSGEEHLSDAEKARRERTRTATRGIVDVDVSEDGKTVMVTLGDKIYLIDRASKARKTIDPGGPVYDPHLSPDGQSVAFVRDGDVWIASLAKPPRKLTTHPEGFEYGVAEFAAQEELGRRRGFWWSPDSTKLLFQRTDARNVATIYVSDPRHPDRPSVPFKYPRAGTTNATVDLGIITVANGGDPKWITWDAAKIEYLVAVDWHAHAPPTAMVTNRDQTDVQLLAIDPTTGGQHELVHDHDDAWLNLDVGMPMWLDDGSGFLWMTEQHGAWTLELHAPDGKLVRQLTTPEFGLRRVVGIDNGAAIVEASTVPPKQDVYRIPLDGKAPVRLDDVEGVSDAVSKHGITIITTAAHTGGIHTVAVAGAARHEIPSVAEQPSLVPTTAIETVEIGGRTQYVAVTRPRNFDPKRKYPVIVKVYGGPHAMTVVDARDAYVMDQFYADAGFIVFRTDGRGTPNRGRAWERATLKDLIKLPLDDQVAGLQATAAHHPEMDMTKVGITGWSFGGYFTLMALLLRPDVFAAGVAGAPVTDWSLYDTAYTERYMKTPAQNPDGYKSTSANENAGKLSRPLLIIHGITDDNVHFANSLSFIEAMYLAGKRAEVITLSSTHMVPDPKLVLAREKVQVDFFRTHLR